MSTLTKKDVSDFVDTASKMATTMLTIAGYHEPIMIVVSPTGMDVVSLADIMEAFEKTLASGRVEEAYAIKGKMSFIMKEILKKLSAYGYAFITEAWLRKVKKEDVQLMGGDEPGKGGYVAENPRCSPDRLEALTLNWEFKMADSTKAGGIRSWVFNRVDGKIVLDPHEDTPNDVADGRFVGLLE